MEDNQSPEKSKVNPGKSESSEEGYRKRPFARRSNGGGNGSEGHRVIKEENVCSTQ
jgi:hypothetical protein